MVLSIIDIGSNSVRMDVIKIDDDSGRYEYLERCRELVKLSEGMNIDGCLRTEAIDRTVALLSEYKSISDGYGADDCIAIATAAVRKAGNSEEFCRRVLDEANISINVIPGEQEAEYDFRGVIDSLKISDCVIADTGGGSTEFILVSDGEPLARTSIPVGAVNMTEQFLSYGETYEAKAALSDYISSQLDKIPWLDDVQDVPIVGLGGSIYSLAIVSAGGQNTDANALHGKAIDSADITAAFEDISAMTAAERLDAGIEAGRTDTILAGVMPITELIKKIGAAQVIVSSAGLREGVLAEFLENIGL